MLLIISLLLFLSCYDKKHKKIYIISSCVLLILYSTFRAFLGGDVIVGNDYYSYQKWFNSIQRINIMKVTDFAFNILMYIISVTTKSYLLFIGITSSLFIYSIYRFSIDNTDNDNYVWAIFIFISFGIYELGMSAIRQWMAGALFLLSFKYIKEHNFFKYLFMILLASLFHSSALILILVYPFINIKLSKKIKLIITMVVTVLLTIAVKYNLDLTIISKLDPSYIYKYEKITEGMFSNYTVFIIATCCFLAIMLFKDKYKKNAKNWNLEINYLIMLMAVSFLATKSVLCGRFLQYFLPALMLVIPGIINVFNKKFKKIVSICAILVLFLIFIM